MIQPGIPDDRQVISDDLYREVILDHYRSPRHRGLLDPADVRVEGKNPLCGDELTLTMRLGPGGAIDAVGVQGAGCAISQASVSMMAEAVHGGAVETAERYARLFKEMLLEGRDPGSLPGELEELKALESVKRYPVRIKCALLAWNALLEAIREVKHDGKGKGQTQA